MHDDEAMRALLAHGARVDLPNVMGVTPLMAAAGVGVREPGFGANRAPDFTSKQIESEVIASLEILLAAGADVNAAVTDMTEPHGAHRAPELDDGPPAAQTALHRRPAAAGPRSSRICSSTARTRRRKTRSAARRSISRRRPCRAGPCRTPSASPSC